MIFTVLAKNHIGTLLRIAGLFSRRGFNIESIVAFRTKDPLYTRIDILTNGDDETLAQITRQLLKLEDVVQVDMLPPDQADTNYTETFSKTHFRGDEQ